MTRTREEFETIVKICERAEAMNIAPRERITLILDLENAHKTVGLNLNGLLSADDMDFAHDVLGIQAHMNRDTGELEDFFLPRYAKKYSQVEELIEDATERSSAPELEFVDNRKNAILHGADDPGFDEYDVK